MKLLKLYDTYGWIAIASLIICGISGVMLIIPYDPSNAYLSITTFIITNTATSFSRNIHYWSAQIFLVFTILHFYEHFSKIKAETPEDSVMSPRQDTKKRKLKSSGLNVSHGTWLRLVLSLLVIFYVMLSGFILKDDADSRQAHQLLSTLLQSIPYIGEYLNASLVGSTASLNILYLHHAATATIIIIIIIVEHVRSIKVKRPTFVYTSLIVLIISFFFRAPLTQIDDSFMKGPWYFIGVQEMLHLTSHPLIVISLLFIVLILVYLVPFIGRRFIPALKWGVLIISVMYLFLTLTGYFFRGPLYNIQIPFTKAYQSPSTLTYNILNFASDSSIKLTEISGGIEGCISCHSGMKGLSDAHNPAVIGCYRCHGGDPLTLDANQAHRSMHKVPGNLSNAPETCGGSGCHDNIIDRVPKSIMATMSGIISVDKWVFGEIEQPVGLYHVADLKNKNSDQHLRNLCAGCHLSMEKTIPGTSKWIDRGGGCNACHLTYDQNSEKTLSELESAKKDPSVKWWQIIMNTRSNKKKPLFHPEISVNVTNDKCESCHSRSGRISLSYSGWHETRLKQIPTEKDENSYRLLPDGRVTIRMTSDVHHDAGMLCIDCHNSYELMGDGSHYEHKEDALKVKCIDCHPTDIEKINTSRLSETDRETQLISWLRGWSENDPHVIITSKDKSPLVNTSIDKNKNLFLAKKADNIQLKMKPALPECFRDKAHERLECETCHTAWVPQCLGCHNSYESKTKGYDMLTKKQVTGTWVEHIGESLAEPPTLGLKYTDKSDKDQRITIFSPGMIMTIEKQINHQSKKEDISNSVSFHRLYAPVSGHTTQRKSRSCSSCHLNSLAVGYGRGNLRLSKEGKWIFEPHYELNKHDNLPEDVWIGFLSQGSENSVTRLYMRPFNINEQKKILRVGACLTCHDEGSKVMKETLNDFEATIKRMSAKCIMPKYK